MVSSISTISANEFATQNPIAWGLLEFLERQMPSSTAAFTTTNAAPSAGSSSLSRPSSTSSSSRSNPAMMPTSTPLFIPNASIMPAKSHETMTDEEYEVKKVVDRWARTFKTQMCFFEGTGHCPRGEQCNYAHSSQELRAVALPAKYKTALCRTFSSTGSCGYGKKCLYIHRL